MIVRLTAHVDHTVQLSGVPAPPTVLKYPAAQTETAMVTLVLRNIVRKQSNRESAIVLPRLSLAEAQVYVAPVAALSTVGQVVHAPESR